MTVSGNGGGKALIMRARSARDGGLREAVGWGALLVCGQDLDT